MEQQQCPRCHFTLPQQARTCSWCGLSLADVTPVRPLTLPIASTASLASGMNGLTMPALEALLAQSGTPAELAENRAGVATSLDPGSQAAFKRTPRKRSRRFSQSLDLWWMWVIAVIGVLIWSLARDAHFASDALSIAGRLCLVGTITLGALVLGMRGARHGWRGLSAPIGVAVALGLIGAASLGLSTRLDALQATQAEQQGNFARAIVLYQHSGDMVRIAQARLAWVRALLAKSDFTDAQNQATQALAQARGTEHDQALAELGTVLWQWGTALHQNGDDRDASGKWQAAAHQAAGTPDGDRALAALQAPQAVHGVMLWQGKPAQHVQVSLVSQWRYTSAALLTSGQRLTSTTDDTGAFTIAGAVPGTTYALVWQGASGDTTVLTAEGAPLYTIAIAPLVGGDFGTISIGAA